MITPCLAELPLLRRDRAVAQNKILGEIGGGGDADQRVDALGLAASAASSMIQPPMLEPTRICGPSVS